MGSNGGRSSGTRSATFHSFTDMPSGGFSFNGTGKDTADWFFKNSNCDQLINEIQSNFDSKRAFSRWMSGAFMDGQQWSGFDSMTDMEKENTRQYDKFLDRATLKSGVVVRRLATAELLLGKGNKYVNDISELQAMEGKTILAKGNMSTAAAGSGLAIGASLSKEVEYKLSIPGGSKGAGMWIGDYRIGGWGPEQREFMTNRDTHWKVGKTTYDSSRGVYVVELKYAGREEHDYGRRGR